MQDLFERLNPKPDYPGPVTPTTAQEKTGRVMVKRHLRRHGWIEDRWGNYHHPAKPGCRYKLTQRVLRYEARLGDSSWMRLRSGFYRHLYVNGDDILCGLSK